MVPPRQAIFAVHLLAEAIKDAASAVINDIAPAARLKWFTAVRLLWRRAEKRVKTSILL